MPIKWLPFIFSSSHGIKFIFSSEQILTLSAQLFNVHTTWKKEKDKQTCSKKGKGNTQPTDKKISNSENLNCSTKPKLILSDKILTPMSKVMYHRHSDFFVL